jgi:transcription initiation factor IIE alpha subunit
MFESTAPRVFFICRGCSKMFVAEQMHEPAPGRYDCDECGKPVHDWDGSYSFTGWKPA